MATPAGSGNGARNLLLPVLPLGDVCLFPEASLTLVATQPAAYRAIDLAVRAEGRVLALASREKAGGTAFDPRDLHAVGTIAEVTGNQAIPDGTRRVELDGIRRARAVEIFGLQAAVAEAEPLDEGDPGDEWGAAVEALARYLHTHGELRGFLEQQRRSAEAMSWVNLACQHLPITATARQKLLESDAPARCLRISRGLDALLRKEHGS
jgi:ATP-dependent Lon protease